MIVEGIITNKGKEKLSQSLASGIETELVYFRVTDQDFDLDPNLIDLPSYWYQDLITAKEWIDKNTLKFICEVPATKATKVLKGIGIYTRDGDLFAVGKIVDGYLPPYITQKVNFVVKIDFQDFGDVVNLPYSDDTLYNVNLDTQATLLNQIQQLAKEIAKLEDLLLHTESLLQKSVKETGGKVDGLLKVTGLADIENLKTKRIVSEKGVHFQKPFYTKGVKFKNKEITYDSDSNLVVKDSNGNYILKITDDSLTIKSLSLSATDSNTISLKDLRYPDTYGDIETNAIYIKDWIYIWDDEKKEYKRLEIGIPDYVNWKDLVYKTELKTPGNPLVHWENVFDKPDSLARFKDPVWNVEYEFTAENQQIFINQLKNGYPVNKISVIANHFQNQNTIFKDIITTVTDISDSRIEVLSTDFSTLLTIIPEELSTTLSVSLTVLFALRAYMSKIAILGLSMIPDFQTSGLENASSSFVYYIMDYDTQYDSFGKLNVDVPNQGQYPVYKHFQLTSSKQDLISVVDDETNLFAYKADMTILNSFKVVVNELASKYYYVFGASNRDLKQSLYYCIDKGLNVSFRQFDFVSNDLKSLTPTLTTPLWSKATSNCENDLFVTIGGLDLSKFEDSFTQENILSKVNLIRISTGENVNVEYYLDNQFSHAITSTGTRNQVYVFQGMEFDISSGEVIELSSIKMLNIDTMSTVLSFCNLDYSAKFSTAFSTRENGIGYVHGGISEKSDSTICLNNLRKIDLFTQDQILSTFDLTYGLANHTSTSDS